MTREPDENEVRKEAWRLAYEEEGKKAKAAEKTKQNGGFRNANAERQRAKMPRWRTNTSPAKANLPWMDEVERLRDLSDAEYEQERKGAAAGLGIRVSALDRFVAAGRAPPPMGLCRNRSLGPILLWAPTCST